MAKDDTKGESLNDAAVISAFKDKTKEKFHELDGMDPETIEANVKTIVQGIVNNFAPLCFIVFQHEFGLSLAELTFIITINLLERKLHN